jgi:hypothetical protein
MMATGDHFRVGDRVYVDMDGEPNLHAIVIAESLPQHVTVSLGYHVTPDGPEQVGLYPKASTHRRRETRVGERPEEFTTPNGLRVGMRVRHRFVENVRGQVASIDQADGTLICSDGDALNDFRDRWAAFEVNTDTPGDPPRPDTSIPRVNVRHNVKMSPELTAVLNALGMESPPLEIRLALAVLVGDLESAGPLADLVAEQRRVTQGENRGD